jgi:hypothetical protein
MLQDETAKGEELGEAPRLQTVEIIYDPHRAALENNPDKSEKLELATLFSVFVSALRVFRP